MKKLKKMFVIICLALMTKHIFIYKSRGDGRTHNAFCNCGYSQTEACIGLIAMGGTASCSKCRQQMSSGGTFYLQSTNKRYCILI